jgi:hypothetical protein
MVYTLGMAKHNSTPYRKMSQASGVMQETKDCAVIAIAIVADLTYMNAHSLLRRTGRKPQATTCIEQIHQALKLLNIKTRDVTKQYRDTLGAKTIRTLGRVMADRKGVYLAYTCDHIMAIKDGVIHDWLDGHLHRITQVVKLKRENTK